MNRLLWSTDEPMPAGENVLPPRNRVGPARVLFFNGSELGFATSARSFETISAVRSDIDAVHVRVPIKGLLRLAGAPVPERWQQWSLGTTRLALAYGVVLRRLLRNSLPLEHFDVVHFMTQQRSWPIVALAGRPGVATKFVTNVDATVPGWCREFGWAESPLGLDARVERRIMAHADMVVCASRWVADSAVTDSGADAGKIVLDKPCVPIDESAPFRRHDETPTRGTRGGGLVRIVFVGNDWERKGGPRLIRWHQDRWRDIAEVHVCSRTAPQDHSLRNVVWHGATPRDKLLGEVLPNSDVLVMPTKNDTFMIAAQEAQAAGLPVVSSRIAGIPEVVRHGRTGYLCRWDDDEAFIDSIERLLKDHALRREMGMAARAFALANLSGVIWKNHLFDQIVALADGRPLRYAPEGVDLRRSDAETRSPRTQSESLREMESVP